MARTPGAAVPANRVEEFRADAVSALAGVVTVDSVDWLIWLAAGVVLTILELMSLDLILLMLAVGCVAGMLVALPSDSWTIEALVAIVVSASMLALVRPNLVQRLHHGPELRLGSQRLIGEQTRTAEEISASHPGQVVIAGEQWTAQPYTEGSVIPAGTTVEVLAIQGATALVHPLMSPLKEL
jgi:membrane protein implicated in regulation of membrane protease activity